MQLLGRLPELLLHPKWWLWVTIESSYTSAPFQSSLHEMRNPDSPWPFQKSIYAHSLYPIQDPSDQLYGSSAHGERPLLIAGGKVHPPPSPTYYSQLDSRVIPYRMWHYSQGANCTVNVPFPFITMRQEALSLSQISNTMFAVPGRPWGGSS